MASTTLKRNARPAVGDSADRDMRSELLPKHAVTRCKVSLFIKAKVAMNITFLEVNTNDGVICVLRFHLYLCIRVYV